MYQRRDRQVKSERTTNPEFVACFVLLKIHAPCAFGDCASIDGGVAAASPCCRCLPSGPCHPSPFPVPKAGGVPPARRRQRRARRRASHLRSRHQARQCRPPSRHRRRRPHRLRCLRQRRRGQRGQRGRQGRRGQRGRCRLVILTPNGYYASFSAAAIKE